MLEALSRATEARSAEWIELKSKIPPLDGAQFSRKQTASEEAVGVNISFSKNESNLLLTPRN